VSEKAGAEILFADITPQTKPMEWKLSFDAKGRLLKVKHTVSEGIVERPVPGTAVQVTAPGHSCVGILSPNGIFQNLEFVASDSPGSGGGTELCA
jgi:hypothetical protein